MKLALTFAGPVAEAQLAANRRHSRRLGLPAPVCTDRPPLAVVGGGPSVRYHFKTLRAWPGDIWAACGAWPWLAAQGIAATFFNADPQPGIAALAAGARRAIVTSCSDPAVFAALAAAGAEVTVFDLYQTEAESNHGCSTITCAPHLAVEMGHPSVSFFGCDSSYQVAPAPSHRPAGVEAGVRSHAYAHQPTGNEIVVAAGGETFTTSLQLFGQAQCLAEILRAAPHYFICRSGGLLAALLQDPDYHVISGLKGANDHGQAETISRDVGDDLGTGAGARG